MSLTMKFTLRGQEIEVNEKELHQLNEAVTYALNGSAAIVGRQFGFVRVDKAGPISRNTVLMANDPVTGKEKAIGAQTDC